MNNLPIFEKVYLYSYYVEGGTTTPAVKSILNKIKAANTERIEIEETDIERLNSILQSSCKSRIFRFSKSGIYLLYLDFQATNGDIFPLVLVYNSGFIDFEHNCIYHIHDEKDKKWLEQFQNKCRNKELKW